MRGTIRFDVDTDKLEVRLGVVDFEGSGRIGLTPEEQVLVKLLFASLLPFAAIREEAELVGSLARYSLDTTVSLVSQRGGQGDQIVGLLREIKSLLRRSVANGG